MTAHSDTLLIVVNRAGLRLRPSMRKESHHDPQMPMLYPPLQVDVQTSRK
jgi:hypothetical protein